MRAAVLFGVGESVRVEERPGLDPAPGEAIVSLSAAALNRRDVWIRMGQYAGLNFPIVLGSDGVGVVDAVDGGDPSWVGKEVVINPSLGWGSAQTHQDQSTFQILGLPRDGTFAEQVAVPVENLVEKPSHLTAFEAAALPLAGLTAYRALVSRASTLAGEKVLITGAGGGAATFAVLFAVALGADVYVTSGSQEKIQRAKQLGALGGASYRDADWDQQLKKMAGGFDVVIDSTMGEGFSKLVELANPGGRIAFFGATAGNPPEFNVRRIFWKQLTLLGTTMGSPTDFAEMTGLVAATKLKPVVDDVFPLERANDALDRMQNSGQFGKIVLEI